LQPSRIEAIITLIVVVKVGAPGAGGSVAKLVRLMAVEITVIFRHKRVRRRSELPVKDGGIHPSPENRRKASFTDTGAEAEQVGSKQ